MDTLPLPPRPNTEQYKKRAKDLVAATRSADENAIRLWATEWLQSLTRLLNVEITPFVQSSFDRAVAHIEARVREKRAKAGSSSTLALADAQHLIADAHGFENWAAFSRHLDRFASTYVETDPFEAAADAVVGGDLEVLDSLLQANPGLVRARSSRVHKATLLHYVAANGVEDFRQKTPPNAVAIARRLLEAGAEVDAQAKTYSGGWYETTLNLLVSSAHPAGAGLQPALVDVLADFGSAMNGVKDDESPLMTALDFGYADAAEALVRRGARIDSVASAAALGRLDLIKDWVVNKTTITPGVPLIAPPWRKLPDVARDHIELALVWACKFKHADVADWLIAKDVNPAAKDGYEMTAIHWAAPHGLSATTAELLRRKVPLEVENTWGGTVLDSTLHFALYMPVAGVDYPKVFEMLLAAGADVRAVTYPCGIEAVDEVFKRYGAS